MALKITMEFASESGVKPKITFDESTWTATSVDGFSGPYKIDHAAKQLHTASPNGEMVITFDEMTAPEVGATTAYSTSTGDKGTATITAVE